MSTELIGKIDSILSKISIPERHTFFQIEKFMIGKEPTAHAQLWSILRELQARKETIDTYLKDLADAEDNLELLDIKIARFEQQIQSLKFLSSPEELNIKECEINIRKLQREKEALIKSAQKANARLKGVYEEASHLIAGFEKIVAIVGEPKPFDDEMAQREMWNEKLLEEFNLRFILRLPFDPEFIKTVMCLPDDSSAKKQVVHLINGIQNKMLPEEKKKPQVNVLPKIAGK